jgi:hypothetical protein
MDLLNPEGECFPIRASYIKTDLIPPNAGLHYSNIPVFQPVPPKSRLGVTKADTPWHLFAAKPIICDPAQLPARREDQVFNVRINMARRRLYSFSISEQVWPFTALRAENRIRNSGTAPKGSEMRRFGKFFIFGARPININQLQYQKSVRIIYQKVARIMPVFYWYLL